MDRSRGRQGGYGGREDERGFFEHAGEAVGNFFGTSEGDRDGGSSRSNYQDYERERSGGYGRDYGNDYGARGGGSSGGGVQSWGGGSDWQSGQRGSADDHRGASSPFDDHYRSWRDQQIS